MKILIVDDDPATVTFMRLAFSAAGHDVQTSSSVDEALGTATELVPDVVLTDLTFGSGAGTCAGRQDDGWALARSLRSTDATSLVGLLAVSGAGSADSVGDALEAGFDGFVSKPVDLHSLLEQVDRLGDDVAERRNAPAVHDQIG